MIDGQVLVSEHIGHFEVYIIYDYHVQARRNVNLRKGPGQTTQLIDMYGGGASKSCCR